MKIPNQENLELPLLKVLADAGGSLTLTEAISKVKEYYPDLTDEDKASTLTSGGNRLNNRIQWTRKGLVLNGEMDGSVRGLWKITERGRQRLAREWNNWKPDYSELLGSSSKTTFKTGLPINSEKHVPNATRAGALSILGPDESLNDAVEAIKDQVANEIL